jgi:hypothetical protein
MWGISGVSPERTDMSTSVARDACFHHFVTEPYHGRLKRTGLPKRDMKESP